MEESLRTHQTKRQRVIIYIFLTNKTPQRVTVRRLSSTRCTPVTASIIHTSITWYRHLPPQIPVTKKKKVVSSPYLDGKAQGRPERGLTSRPLSNKPGQPWMMVVTFYPSFTQSPASRNSISQQKKIKIPQMRIRYPYCPPQPLEILSPKKGK